MRALKKLQAKELKRCLRSTKEVAEKRLDLKVEERLKARNKGIEKNLDQMKTNFKAFENEAKERIWKEMKEKADELNEMKKEYVDM